MSEEKKERVMQTVFNNKSGLNVIGGSLLLSGNYTDNVSFLIISKYSNENNLKKIWIEINIPGYNAQLVKYGIIDRLINKLSHKYKNYNNWEYDQKAGRLTFKYDDVEIITSTKLAIKYEKETMKILRALNAVIAYIEKMINSKIERENKMAEKKANNKVIENEAAEAVPGAQAYEEQSQRGFYEVDENNQPVSI